MTVLVVVVGGGKRGRVEGVVEGALHACKGQRAWGRGCIPVS